MSHRITLFGLFAMAVLAFALPSCRTPSPLLLEDPSVGYIYDPKTSDKIAEDFKSDAMKELNDRYRTALAEPVSVVAWEPDHSAWEVFFATNRTGALTAEGTTDFGPAWGQELSVGTCRVTLPKSERGTSTDKPKLTAKLASWIPGYAIENRNESAKVAVAPPQPMEGRAFFQSVRQTVDRAPEHDVLIFVHGFNVDFAGSVTRTAQIGLDLPFNGAIIAYSWPSQGGIGNYGTDEQIVAESVTPFVSFLDQLDQSLPPDARIHLIVHSMGNRLVLHGLSRLPERFCQPARFENIVLAAPDLGVSDFSVLSQSAVLAAKRVTLYVNGGDSALIASKGLHGEQRIGDAFPPVVVPGVETINASAIDTSFMGHSYYSSNRRALSDLFAVVKENRGAAQRSWLKTEAGDAGPCWTFSSQPVEVRCTWYFDELAAK
jgi:esterase/lipase superfamily enzyme